MRSKRRLGSNKNPILMKRKRNLRPKNRRNLSKVRQQQQVQIFTSEDFSGPLPPPQMLARYEEVYPGLVDRMVSLTESQSAHRQKMEAKVISSNVSSQLLGLILSALICLVSISGGIYLILCDKDISGLASTITPLAALVGVFIYAKREQRIERESKNLNISR